LVIANPNRAAVSFASGGVHFRIVTIDSGVIDVMNDRTKNRLIEFSSQLGWMQIIHNDGIVLSTRIGFRTRWELRRLPPTFYANKVQPDSIEQHWIDCFRAYAEGLPQNFSSLTIDESWMTLFQSNVTRACRAIPHGRTMTYGQLASRAGSPGAARAVGGAMGCNRYPLIVPCHRVVGSGNIGGFSASRGIELKLKLLRLEGIDDYESSGSPCR
jgi:methylated-DNA-[protein]-cysteine S-methyltransferase